MSLVHIHLILNHLPILGIPIVAVFLAHSLWKGNQATQKFSLLALLLISLMVLPVYFTGEPAEDVAEKLPGVTKALIHNHEEAGEVAFFFTLATGVVAAAGLFLQKAKLKDWMVRGALALAVVSAATLAYTGYLGGMVRHSEIREGSASTLVPAVLEENSDKD